MKKKRIRPDILTAVIMTAAAAASGLYAGFGTEPPSAPAVSVSRTAVPAETTCITGETSSPEYTVYAAAAASVCDAAADDDAGTTALVPRFAEEETSAHDTDDAEAAPVQETVPAQETAPVQEKAPVQETAPAQEKAPVQEKAPADMPEAEVICIDINTASVEELCLLDGIGETTARKIIEYRTENGGFSDTEQLMEVSGIGEKKFSAISEMIYTSGVPVRRTAAAGYDTGSGRININTATEKELMALDGIGEATARKIVEYRTENGGFSAAEDIMEVKGIGEKKYDAIKNKICVQ